MKHLYTYIPLETDIPKMFNNMCSKESYVEKSILTIHFYYRKIYSFQSYLDLFDRKSLAKNVQLGEDF